MDQQEQKSSTEPLPETQNEPSPPPMESYFKPVESRNKLQLMLSNKKILIPMLITCFTIMAIAGYILVYK